MSVAQSSDSRRQPGRIRRGWRWLVHTWEDAQIRLSTMVLTDVPIVLTATALLLTLFGIMMVLSASSVEQISSGASPFGQAKSQTIFGVAGFVLMLVVGYLVPVAWYRRPLTLTVLLGFGVILLTAVIFLGENIKGNRNWLPLPGGYSIQPSEFVKPIMILWLASVYSRQGRLDGGTPAQNMYKGLMPAILGFGLVIALILAGHDAGTVLVYGIFFAAIFLAAKPARELVISVMGLAALAGLVLVIMSSNRLERILNTFLFWKECVEASCDQANSGLAALATGGFWGVGLGQSRQKYNYLAEAHNDYIFAVIGEELGMVGGLAVLVLYATLIYCSIRIMLRSSDLFIRYATLGLIAWITGQALMNIGMVVGILPVIGVPLPFISAGGSSLVASLAGLGILIAFARQTPLNPIMGESGAPLNAKDARDKARRQRIAEFAEAEQAVINRDPDGAGWTLDKLMSRFHQLVDGRDNRQPRTASPRPVRASAAHTRPSSATVRRSQAPTPTESVEAAKARRSSSVSGARPSAQVQQAQQAYQRQSSQKAGKTPAQQAPATPVARPEGPAAPAERRVPAGLRTIRKARQLPTDRQG